MRPLSLEIAGLQSFRELRAIDFEPLLRDNLFGIFGPTGSGKSTILDAITLALFGRVERTKGSSIASAINSSESHCSVAFRFEIDSERGRERYLVERSYKVRKSGMKSDARLIRESDNPPTPLADKSSEVGEELNKIIGITADDFSRAVVLPQGAFAEFLAMTPKDRGALLQRIFGLEKLGYRINSQLSEMRRILESKRLGFEERLSLLSEYNDEALEEQGREYREAKGESQKSRQLLEEIEKSLKTSEELYGLTLERDQLLAGEGERVKIRIEQNKLQETLKAAEQALALEGVVQKAKESQRRWNEAQDSCDKGKKITEDMQKKMEHLYERKQKADQWKKNEQPVLEKEIEVLTRVVELDRRGLPFENSLKDREKVLEESKQLIKVSRLELERAEEGEKRAKQGQKEVAQTIESAEKKIAELTEHAYALERLEGLAKIRDEKEILLKKAVKDEENIQRQRKELKKSLEIRREEEREKTLQRDDIEKEFEKSRREHGLVEALALLVEGEPCPLCGSTEHPHPHLDHETNDLIRLKEELKRVEKKLKESTDDVRSLEKDEATLLTSANIGRERREELEKEVKEAIAEIEQMVIETEYKGEVDSVTFREWRKKIGEQLEGSERKREEEKKELVKFESILEKTEKTLTEGRTKVVQLEAKITSTNVESNRERRELEDVRKERDKLLSTVDFRIELGKGEDELRTRKETLERYQKGMEKIDQEYGEMKEELDRALAKYEENTLLLKKEELEMKEALEEQEKGLKKRSFISLEAWNQAWMESERMENARKDLEQMKERLNNDEGRLQELVKKIGKNIILKEELEEERDKRNKATDRYSLAQTALGKAEEAFENCKRKNSEWKKAQRESEKVDKEQAAMKQLSSYLQGNAFINYIADEQLKHVCRTASAQLHELTAGRLEIDSQAGKGFIVRDFGNGGIERSTSSLSGGETFLVSLSLALALSESLQLRGAPLEFFFLDEGFGTLDSDLLETVMNALERLRANSHRAIGVISHVESLQERIPRRLIVSPAVGEQGSDVQLDV